MAGAFGILTTLLLITLGLASPDSSYACEQRELTRETGPGPHDFSLGVPDPKLWREGDEGEPLFLRARVLDGCGEPVVRARVQILHANQYGDHELDRWRADLQTDDRGTFNFVTVFPGYTGGLPRHIHFVITHPAHPQLVTRLFFKNDPSVDEEIENLAVVPEEVSRDGNRGWVVGYEFVLAPR